MAAALSKYEERLFEAALRGNLNVFSEYYFRLPFSGTRYTPEDRVKEYATLHEAWGKLGKPGDQMVLLYQGREITYVLEWGDYGTDPCFLFRHGYLFLPWALDMLTSGKKIAVVEGGTGCSKTSSVGISSIMQCALYPGADILNVAPTTTQATDMLQEIAKWIIGSHFEKFVVPTASGDLFKLKPFPTITIDVTGTPSSFMCMTVGQKGDFVLGKDKDAVRCDEAGLIQNIGDAIPRLISRIRGLRATGKPRGIKPYIAFISNPHDGNYSYEILKEKAKKEHGDPSSMYFFANPKSRDNVYITQQQLEVQMELMDEDEQSRWLDGSDEVFRILGTIPLNIVEECHSPALDELLEIERKKGEAGYFMWREGMGIVRYMLPPDLTHRYLVAGDPGQVNATSLRLNNIPVTCAWDITDFPEKPARLVALNMLDGNGKYGPWIESMKFLMLQYQAMGAYDATGMGKAFAEWPDIENYPLYPVTLSGNNKGTAKTMFLLMAGRGMFAWPKLQVLWHQAKAYREAGPGLNKIPDDVIACMFVSSYYLRFEFWNALAKIFGFNRGQRKDNESQDENPSARATVSRYHRRAGRYARRGRKRPELTPSGTVSDLR